MNGYHNDMIVMSTNLASHLDYLLRYEDAFSNELLRSHPNRVPGLLQPLLYLVVVYPPLFDGFERPHEHDSPRRIHVHHGWPVLQLVLVPATRMMQ